MCPFPFQICTELKSSIGRWTAHLRDKENVAKPPPMRVSLIDVANDPERPLGKNHVVEENKKRLLAAFLEPAGWGVTSECLGGADLPEDDEVDSFIVKRDVPSIRYTTQGKSDSDRIATSRISSNLPLVKRSGEFYDMSKVDLWSSMPMLSSATAGRPLEGKALMIMPTAIIQRWASTRTCVPIYPATVEMAERFETNEHFSLHKNNSPYYLMMSAFILLEEEADEASFMSVYMEMVLDLWPPRNSDYGHDY